MHKTTPGRLDQLLTWSQRFFFGSGATSLIYQVLWTRRLTLTFGHTVLAVSTVLTAYMAGLALGSLLGGRWTDRSEHKGAGLLKTYGYLEGFIGVWAVASLLLLNLCDQGYVWLASAGLSGTRLHLSCFLMAALVLIPPTVAMGATVPLLARMLVARPGEVGPILSRLYGLNTLGAVLGAFLGGFLLLPTLGTTLSMVLTAAVNGLICWGALQTSTSFSEEVEQTEKKSRRKKKKGPSSPPGQDEKTPRGLVLLSFALAGAASMSYQVCWNRSLSLAIGSSIYAFSIILVTFLGGLALGSLCYQLFFKGTTPTGTSLAWVYLAIGLGGAVTVVLVPMLPATFFRMFPLVGGSFIGVLFLDFLLVTALLAPPTFLMGLAFPLATAITSRSLGRLGRTVGEVYGANTLGCIAGAFVSGFVLVPNLGAENSLKLATSVYFLNALLLGGWSRHLMMALLALLLTAGTWTLKRWDTAALASGVAIYSGGLKAQPGSDLFKHPIVYLDGLSSAVSFHLKGENWDVPHMRVNGKVDASHAPGDRLTQYQLGYIPMTLHPAPEKVAIIGLGGGFTVEAVAQCPGVSDIQVAELEPAVLEIAEFWAPFNGKVLEDPRVQVHLNDGRTFIQTGQEKFDVIVSEPSNPWLAGIGNLFTRDFYLRARTRLNDDGVMCQWFNLYATSKEDMLMVIRSFYAAFPEGSLWESARGDLLLIGSTRPYSFPLDRAREIWAGSETVQRHFFESGLYYPETLAGHFLMTRSQALKMCGEGPLNTDDRPLLEFSAPRSLYLREQVDRNHETLWANSDLTLPPGLEVGPEVKDRALLGYVNRGHLKHVQQQLAKEEEFTPDLFLVAGRLKQSEGQRFLDPDYLQKCRKIFAECLHQFPQSSLPAAVWGDLEYQAGQGSYEAAAELYQKALLRPAPGARPYLLQMTGQALVHLDRDGEALPLLREAAELRPSLSTPLSVAGGALIKLRQPERALKALEQALKRNPHDPVALQNKAFALFNLGQIREAERTLEACMELIPGYAEGWTKLGLIRLRAGEGKDAMQALQRALQLNPQDQKALKALEALKS